MKVKIIGGGVIGSYLAMKLGSKARVIEKNQETSRKPCGGLISKNGLEELNLPYKKSIVNKAKGAKIHAGEESFTIEKKSTQAYMLDMLELKKEIREKARDKGASFELGETWKPSEDNEEELLVGADGAHSRVAREKSTENQVYDTYQTLTEYDGEREKVHLYFGNYAPKFFGWIIPYRKGEAKIGIGTRGKNPKKAFRKFIREEEIDLGEIKREESAPIPMFDPGKKITGDNWTLVGDAAGQTKATTGGGVVMGCRAVEYLAKAVEKENMKLYQSRYKKNVYPELLDHLKMRKFLNSTDIENLIKKMKKHGARKLIEKHGDMEHTSKLKREIMKKPQLWPLVVKYWWRAVLGDNTD